MHLYAYLFPSIDFISRARPGNSFTVEAPNMNDVPGLSDKVLVS